MSVSTRSICTYGALSPRTFTSVNSSEMPGHRVALEELLAVDSVRRAHERAGPAAQMRQQPFANGFVIAREIELGDGRTLRAFGPQHLVWRS